jgi:Holliday junction resolvase RusA-like endonuclease
MKWNILIPGPIPSTNHIYGYANGRVYKKAGVETFQAVAAHLTRLARPKGWEPAARIRLTYDFNLTRKADCDNLLKMLNDSIALALGIDDDRFLPCVLSKTMRAKYPFVEVIVENVDEP